MSSFVKPMTWVLGLAFLLGGVAGLFTGSRFLVFEVDTTRNVIYILSGVAGLWAAGSGYAYSRLFLIIFGLLYAIIAILGYLNGHVLGIFAVNMADNYLHVAIAVIGLIVGLGSKK